MNDSVEATCEWLAKCESSDIFSVNEHAGDECLCGK